MSFDITGSDMQTTAKALQADCALDSKQLTELLQHVADRKDKKAFSVLFKHFAPRVKSYIFKLGSDETMAEELAQQTLLQVWRKAHLFDSEKAAASTWIFRIARNLRLDLIRKERHFDYDDMDFTTIEDSSDTPEQMLDRSEEVMLMREALETLPGDQRDIIHLSFYEGLSHGDIADHLDLPLGTVKSRIRLAFQKLKAQVETIR